MKPELILEALDSLRAHKLRTILTVLGIIIGVWSVVVMLAIGEGVQAQVRQSIESMGSNLLIVTPGAPSEGLVTRRRSGNVPPFSLKDVRDIETLPGVQHAAPMTRGLQTVAYGAQDWDSDVVGTTEGYFGIGTWEFENGGAFTERDDRGARMVAVLGKTVAKNLFGEADPVGEVMRIKGLPFEVVGVLKGKGQSIMGDDQDDVVIIPYTTAQRRVFGSRMADNVRTIMVQSPSAEGLVTAEEEIKLLLQERRRPRPGQPVDFSVRNLAEIAETVQKVTGTITWFLGAIAAISLLVGGIGIMNMMLVSVTERTREIGLRKAIGATRRDVLSQFLLEAIAITLTGCFIAIVLGIGTAYVVDYFAGDQLTTDITFGTIFLAVTVSVGMGLFFGFYPARRASKLSPIEALRYG